MKIFRERPKMASVKILTKCYNLMSLSIVISIGLSLSLLQGVGGIELSVHTDFFTETSLTDEDRRQRMK